MVPPLVPLATVYATDEDVAIRASGRLRDPLPEGPEARDRRRRASSIPPIAGP